MPIPSSDPVELEARLLRTIAALRKIRDVLALATDRPAGPPRAVDHEALKGCAALCADYAGSVIDEVTS